MSNRYLYIIAIIVVMFVTGLILIHVPCGVKVVHQEKYGPEDPRYYQMTKRSIY